MKSYGSNITSLELSQRQTVIEQLCFGANGNKLLRWLFSVLPKHQLMQTRAGAAIKEHGSIP